MEWRPPIWKEAPFIRLIIPLAAGIATGYFFRLPAAIYWAMTGCSMIAMAWLSAGSVTRRFRYRQVFGWLIHALLFAFAGLRSGWSDGEAGRKQVEEWCRGSPSMAATVDEPVVLKQKSYKALGTLTVWAADSSRAISLPIMLYFRKDSLVPPPAYGARIVLKRPPQRIKNITAGGFDYERYCALHGLYFQVFLTGGDYRMIAEERASGFWPVLFAVRSWVVEVLRKNIPGRKESGLAEALLIGYKDDLDKGLIQTYSATGVVHVVAISGLHLGLVYGLLKAICGVAGLRRSKGWSAAVILPGLWLFSLLAGGSPSVLRSAVMFSFIVAGEAIGRKTSLFNNLAASAFFLLCYDPLWLWDVGFQLSYAALAGIGLFRQPIYNLIACRNALADAVWKLNAVTLAAQVLTIPLCLYYFHQFPVVFLVANCIAVPLSGIILAGEIALCGVAFIKPLAAWTGWLLCGMLRAMNWSVESLAGWRFAVITGLQVSAVQALLLYALIAALAVWLMERQPKAVPAALAAAILFMAMKLI